MRRVAGEYINSPGVLLLARELFYPSRGDYDFL